MFTFKKPREGKKKPREERDECCVVDGVGSTLLRSRLLSS